MIIALILFYSMKLGIRRSYIRAMGHDASLRKALALAVYVKTHFTSSAVPHYSLNRLHNLTGMHRTTLDKRVDKLMRMRIAIWSAGNQLVVSALKSQCDRLNVCIDFDGCETVKDIEKRLQIVLLLDIQSRKDFAKRMIDAAQNGTDLKEVKKAKKVCRRYGYGREYVEWGLSYKGIAKRLGVSIATAFNVVKQAISEGLIKKFHNQVQRYQQNVREAMKYMDFDFTFCTKDNCYLVLANTYSLTPQAHALCGLC